VLRTSRLSLFFGLVPLVTVLAACGGNDSSSDLPGGGSSENGNGQGGSGGNPDGSAGTSSGAGTSSSGASGSSANGGASGSSGDSASGGAGTSGNGGSSGGAGTAGSDGAGKSGASGSAGTSAGASGSAGAAGSSGSAGSAGSSGNAGASGSAGAAGTGGGSTAWSAGNPNGACKAGVPARGQEVDTSNSPTVVGDGTAGSCTFDALETAVTAGGIITFNCGADPITIPVTATLNVPSTKDTVIDGGRKVTLDGGHAVQILRFYSANFQANDHGLTLQHIALQNAKETPTEAIPDAPAPCSQGWDDGEGGAVYMRDGYLTVIDSIFTGNEAAPLGPDTGGGAIYVLGSKSGVTIVNSTFTNNQASNAGAVGGLFSELDIYNSLFTNNTATGHDANDDDADRCDVMNNGQNEIGSGGNGGAIYSDGNDVNVLLCGDAVLNNAAGMNAFGGGLFFTSNDFGGTLTITDTTMTGNTGGHWTSVKSGSTMDAGTAVGTNNKSTTITNSTLQGL